MSDLKRLEDFDIYKLAMQIGDDIWQIVIGWDNFPKETIGKQVVRSADSIAANIAESYGRFSFKERRQFMLFSRGSLLETKTWLNKSYHRQLISQEFYDDIIEKLKILHLQINIYLKVLRSSEISARQV